MSLSHNIQIKTINNNPIINITINVFIPGINHIKSHSASYLLNISKYFGDAILYKTLHRTMDNKYPTINKNSTMIIVMECET
jgi:hypothetical protein